MKFVYLAVSVHALIFFWIIVCSFAEEKQPSQNTETKYLDSQKKSVLKKATSKEKRNSSTEPLEKKKPRVPPEMIPVPGGTFSMGLDGRGIPDEQPAHQVTVGSLTRITGGCWSRQF